MKGLGARPAVGEGRRTELRLPRVLINTGQDGALESPGLPPQRLGSLLGHYERVTPPTAVVYRVSCGPHQQTGVVLEVPVEYYRAGRIKPHEATAADRERRLLLFTETTGVERMPVMLAHAPRTALRSLLQEVTAGPPRLQRSFADGSVHTVWVSADPLLSEAVQREASQLESLYIADGHHRMATAVRYAERRRQLGPDHPSAFTMAVLFPSDELRVRGYRRLLRIQPGVSDSEVLTALAALPVTAWLEATTDRFTAPRSVLIGLDNRNYRLWLRGTRGDPRSALDAVLLQERVIPGIADKAVPVPAGREQIDERVLSLEPHPPTIEQIMAVSDANMLLPPKSTWFDPKVRPGLIVRELR